MTPNILTCLRIPLSCALFFLLFYNGFYAKTLALTVFLAAMLTDYLDGKIARSTGKVTTFGKIMDPIADKFLTLSAFLAFTQMGLIPAWMVLLVVARDSLITGIRLTISEKGDLHAARNSGKNKTALQFTFVIFVLVFLILKEMPFWDLVWNDGWIRGISWVMGAVTTVTLWSGVRYLIKNKALFE